LAILASALSTAAWARSCDLAASAAACCCLGVASAMACWRAASASCALRRSSRATSSARARSAAAWLRPPDAPYALPPDACARLRGARLNLFIPADEQFLQWVSADFRASIAGTKNAWALARAFVERLDDGLADFIDLLARGFDLLQVGVDGFARSGESISP